MQDIRNKFSLDWLSGSSGGMSTQTSSVGQSALDEAVVFYSQPVLSVLAKQGEKTMGLHDLARALKDEIKDFRFADLWEVVKHLESLKFVQIDPSDPTGNYQIKLVRTS